MDTSILAPKISKEEILHVFDQIKNGCSNNKDNGITTNNIEFIEEKTMDSDVDKTTSITISKRVTIPEMMATLTKYEESNGPYIRKRKTDILSIKNDISEVNKVLINAVSVDDKKEIDACLNKLKILTSIINTHITEIQKYKKQLESVRINYGDCEIHYTIVKKIVKTGSKRKNINMNIAVPRFLEDPSLNKHYNVRSLSDGSFQLKLNDNPSILSERNVILSNERKGEFKFQVTSNKCISIGIIDIKSLRSDTVAGPPRYHKNACTYETDGYFYHSDGSYSSGNLVCKKIICTVSYADNKTTMQWKVFDTGESKGTEDKQNNDPKFTQVFDNYDMMPVFSILEAPTANIKILS